MDGHDCDAGGHHCSDYGAALGSAGSGDPGYALGPDGRTPISNIKHVEVNGAPMIDSKNEYVMKRPNAQD